MSTKPCSAAARLAAHVKPCFAIGAARFLAAVVGHSHARQMHPADRHAWAEELRLHRSGGLDAPSWLWSVVVDLVAKHERGYLDHCRDYALAKAS